MSNLYSKALSIEDIYGMYDTNHNGQIDKAEEEKSKIINLFPDFKVESDMSLDKFEKTNLEAYKQYEASSTLAYDKQLAKMEKIYNNLKETDDEELQELEIELKREAIEYEIRHDGFELAIQKGFVLTEQQLNLPLHEFLKLIDLIVNSK